MRHVNVVRNCTAALALGVMSLCVANAQIFTERNVEEIKEPPPPAFDVNRALAIAMPNYNDIEFLLDPGTISIDPDGIVRYVVIARSKRSNGAVNAFYEGMRCSAASLKTYASNTGDKWSPVKQPEWRRFNDMRSTYGVELAKQAICRGDAPRTSVEEMVRTLKRPYVG